MERVMCLTTFRFNGRRMVWLVVLYHCVVSYKGKGIVDVHYERKPFKELMGTPITLTCKTMYVYKWCRHMEVGWHQNGSVGLTDPSRYLTTVNETISEDSRLRQVTTKILSLISEDNGDFQCIAKCENGEQARGHFIEVVVKGQE
ncbi:unnamed protein product [Gadus morhua 'NCC']